MFTAAKIKYIHRDCALPCRRKTFLGLRCVDDGRCSQGGRVDQKHIYFFCSPCPHSSHPPLRCSHTSPAPSVCGPKHSFSFHFRICWRQGGAACHVVFLATLARLDDHIRQLLHLKSENQQQREEPSENATQGLRCSVNILNPWLGFTWLPCAACPRSTGLAEAPGSGERSTAGQKLPGCGVYTKPESVNNCMRVGEEMKTQGLVWEFH